MNSDSPAARARLGKVLVSAEQIAARMPTLAREIVDWMGDGDDDLMWRNTATGAVSGWLVAGAAVQSTSVVHPGIALNWRIESSGDLNADGKDDILWRNMSNGDVNGWLMNGLVKQSGGFIRSVPTSWTNIR